MTKKEKKEEKGLGTFQIILFTFSAVFVLDSLGLPITFGWESLIWWVILGLIFFLPYGLITSELSTTYGSEGGIYNWTKRSYGKRMAGRSIYYYWLSVALWMPTVYLVLGNTMAYAINPSIMQNSWWIWVSVGIAIVATWITVYVNTLPLKEAVWIPSLSSIIKISLVVILLISMFAYLGTGHDVKTNFTDKDQEGIQLQFGGSIAIVGIIVYNMCGFELGTNVEIKDVKKTMVKAIGIGGITIIASYILASIPILVMVNVKDECFQEYYTASIVIALEVICPDWFVIICAFLLALTLFGNMSTWTLGGNGAIVEAAKNDEFIASFAKQNKYGAPYIAALWTGIVSTITVILAGMLSYFTNGDLWYILFSFHMGVFFLPYMIIFLGYIKLRKLYPDEKRPFSIRNNFIAQTVGWLTFSIIVLSTFAQIFDIQIGQTITISPNEDMSGWIGILVTFVGLAITVLIGEYLISKGINEAKNGKGGSSVNHENLIKENDKIQKENSSITKINIFKNNLKQIKPYFKNIQIHFLKKWKKIKQKEKKKIPI